MQSMDNQTIKVGDGVGWKDGHERYGTVKAFENGMLVIVTGDYGDPNDDTLEEIKRSPSRCWVE